MIRNSHDLTLTPLDENYSSRGFSFPPTPHTGKTMESYVDERFCGGSTLYKKLFGICLVYTPMSTLCLLEAEDDHVQKNAV